MTSEISKKVNVQMKNFLELLAVLLDFHQQKKSLTWENMKNQLQLVIDNSISYNNHKSFALSDLIQGSIIAPMKMFSDMYSKFKELSLISFKTHNDSAIIEEKKKLKTLALKLEKHCKKSLDILFMVMAS
jgi:iron-sulfur cluster repair protein YtfE (RIC family)